MCKKASFGNACCECCWNDVMSFGVVGSGRNVFDKACIRSRREEAPLPILLLLSPFVCVVEVCGKLYAAC